jgi:hypothetical protein
MIIPSHPLSRAVNLGFNTGLALAVPWLQVPRAIFGDFSSYADPPRGIDTELSAVWPPVTRERIGTVASATFPIVERYVRGNDSGPYPCPGEHAGKHADQRWFFINGVSSDLRIARLNAQALGNMFGRPITILYNATEGILLDLIEAAAGKGFEAVTDAAAKNLQPLVEALSDPQVTRVVLVSHSQGTIIASILLKTLQELLGRGDAVRKGPGAQKESPERRVARRIAGTLDAGEQPVEAKAGAAQARACLSVTDIAKLELYCFANCSTSMAPIAVVGEPACRVPWIESYGNEYDVVARLGVLAPPHGIGSARIEGDRYRRAAMWGHFLNAHYLIPMLRDYQDLDHDRHRLQPLGLNLNPQPRLLEYVAGQTAAPYPRILQG